MQEKKTLSHAFNSSHQRRHCLSSSKENSSLYNPALPHDKQALSQSLKIVVYIFINQSICMECYMSPCQGPEIAAKCESVPNTSTTSSFKKSPCSDGMLRCIDLSALHFLVQMLDVQTTERFWKKEEYLKICSEGKSRVVLNATERGKLVTRFDIKRQDETVAAAADALKMESKT
ncbi:hypothetical protein ElyMa_004350500 [Elysia marginata]|uniref:Uncharacterized protein n=1 Tax=Elysia marginata TaxID=1093978 RepID=A0AAV4H349_9GAST|nr:hypothetical protein ElyMa_004350500 [Elysia marginata]